MQGALSSLDVQAPALGDCQIGLSNQTPLPIWWPAGRTPLSLGFGAGVVVQVQLNAVCARVAVALAKQLFNLSRRHNHECSPSYVYWKATKKSN